VHCSLIYDIIRKLLQDFSESDVECLLLILGHCGQSLRSDDPRALKEIVLSVQKRVSEVQKDNKESSARVEYMVSAMMDLKNNIRRKQDVTYSEKTAKLRKLLGRIKSSAAASASGVRSSDSTLRITLSDILNAETKGRWWKIGASWVGNQFRHQATDDHDDGVDDDKEERTETVVRVKSLAEADEKLLKLASEYRMNTDTRRSIFCIIMGSADCEDAYEKLVRAGMLKNRMERETVRVLMEGCGNEKAFNKFYALLASRICEYQPQCKFSLQLAFWDVFKQFESVKMRKVANLAKLLFHLVAVHGILKLGMLKVLDMATPNDMHENSLIFLTIFFSRILEHFDDTAQVHRLFEVGIPRGRGGEAVGKAPSDGLDDMDHFDEGEGLRESISAFFIHTLKSSPKNQKGSRFRSNLKAAIKACEPDMLDVF
jgi:nucleolar MIF4G domain-containing protein 1